MLAQLILSIAVSACYDPGWINDVSRGGEYVTSSMGYIFEISSIDTIDTSLWLPTEDLMYCDHRGYRLCNKDAIGGMECVDVTGVYKE